MRKLLPLLLLVLFLPGCGPGGKVAAVVDGRVITVEDVDRRISQMSPAIRASLGADRKRILEQMIMETVLLQEAQKRRLERDPEVGRLWAEARRQILFGRLIEVLRQEGKPAVSQEQIQEFYEENKASFVQPESFRASHILVSDEETARKALTRLKAGEPFPQVAQEFSTDPSASQGGDIGFFTGEQVIPEFGAACKKLKVGELSDAVKSSLGFHLILLTEKKPAGQRPLQEVEAQVQNLLEQRERQRHVEQVVQELRRKAQVQIREGAPGPASAPPSAAPSGQPPASTAPNS